MPSHSVSPAIAELRERIAHLEGPGGRARPVLPFGLNEIDRRLPGGGLGLGCLHEVAGGGNGAAAALFYGRDCSAHQRPGVLRGHAARSFCAGDRPDRAHLVDEACQPSAHW